MWIERIGNEPAQIILALATMMLTAFLATRVTKWLHLPQVTGYLLAGILAGPYVLDLIPQNFVEHMSFVTDVALACIAFGVGKYFKFATLKKSGAGILVLTVTESLGAAVVVTLVMALVFRLSWSFSLLLGAIASATAPASTIMTIRQYHAKGVFVNTLLQVVALDDAVALIAFSVAAAIVQELQDSDTISWAGVLMPVVYNLLALVLGGICGWILCRALGGKEHTVNTRLALLLTLLLFITGLCAIVQISPLLSCMVMGMVYINLGGDKRLFKQLNRFTPPVLLLFFVLSGMRLDLNALASAGLIGVTYFFVRILGKYAGAWLGARAMKLDKSVQNYLGFALVPQAGVSIGLAALGQRLLPGEPGVLLSVIILSSGVLYEMVGPVCAKMALRKAGAFAQPAKPAAPASDAPPPAEPPAAAP